MEINYSLITILIVLGAVCILFIFHLCELCYEEYRNRQILINQQLHREREDLPPPYETVITNPP